ncbi:MAG: hypothetical protein ABIL20_08790, partial [candidate division WOR-3 bacterium]
MKIRNFVSLVEQSSIIHSIVIVIAWIFLRVFFEGILEISHTAGYSRFSYQALLMYFVHFPLFYITTFLLITVLLSIVLREDIIRVTKITSIGTGLIILVPIIDHIISGGCFISYPARLEKYFLHFLNPFVSLTDIGVSIGQRITIFLICVFAALYGYLKNARIMKAIFVFFIVLLAILFSGALTTIIACNRPETLYVTGGILKTDTQKLSAIYVLFFVIIFFVYLFIFDKKNFQLLISSMRVERMAFYGGLGVAGFILAGHQSGIIYKVDFWGLCVILLIFLCGGFGFWALQILNDFFDLRSDAISRARNPINRGIREKYYFLAGLCFSLITLIFSAI